MKIICCLTLLASSWCVADNVEFDAARNADIKNIAVIQTDGIEQYDVNLVSNSDVKTVLSAFGLVGALISYSLPKNDTDASKVVKPLDLTSKGRQLTDALDPKKTNLQQFLADRLAEKLNSEGYSAKIFVVKNAQEQKAILDDKKFDAVVSTKIYSAYLAQSLSTPYYPFVQVDVGMLNARNEQSIYFKTFTFGYNFPFQHSTQVGSGRGYSFQNMSDLLASPAKTREGLTTGLIAIANQVSIDLDKNKKDELIVENSATEITVNSK